ncbi:MAG: hypothetical protein IRZ04_12880 [Rhodospirillales bacterium]|nr:hypothetical protein [Rhodospirillales bacterium]
MAPSVRRALMAIARYEPPPERIDEAILAAINVTLILAAHGDDRVSDGFNRDLFLNGRSFSAAVRE